MKQQKVDDYRDEDTFANGERPLDPRGIRAQILKVDVHEGLSRLYHPVTGTILHGDEHIDDAKGQRDCTHGAKSRRPEAAARTPPARGTLPPIPAGRCTRSDASRRAFR